MAATTGVLAASPDNDRGPFAADFPTLIRIHERPIRAALRRHDASAANIRAQKIDWVITYGEPKPNNTMITTAKPVLVDWDTVRLAPPARDLWMLGSTTGYTSATGRQIPDEQLDFYRRRWDLNDLCESAGWFTAPHQRSTDTELARQGSIKICHRLADNL